MPRIHFLNVNDGDCSVIQHNSGRVTVIDVSAAEPPKAASLLEAYNLRQRRLARGRRPRSKIAGVVGNFNQSENPDNPIDYLTKIGITSVFRFVSTHPDMDHLDGIKPFFEAFRPANFWDTANTRERESFDSNRYDEDDWLFYKWLRDNNPQYDPVRLVLYSGAAGHYYNRDESNRPGGDGLNVLAPTKDLIRRANETEDWNDSSYVLLYHVHGRRVIFSGDSEDGTWEHILKHWRKWVRNADVLIAPHHGRDSGRKYDFLNEVMPKLTLFGNAPTEHMAYDEWNDRELLFVTNDEAGTIVLDVNADGLDVYVKHRPYAEAFTRRRGYDTFPHHEFDGWYIWTLG